MLIAIILLILVISVFFYYKNNNSNKSPNQRNTPIKTQQQKLQSMIDSKRYWGFNIDFINENQCCEAALQAAKKPFPINSVPALPLDNCTKSICRCKHTGLVEKRKPLQQRRKKNDRRDNIRFEEISDRRAHTDRRSDNWVLRK